jgi:hypothetical protein
MYSNQYNENIGDVCMLTVLHSHILGHATDVPLRCQAKAHITYHGSLLQMNTLKLVLTVFGRRSIIRVLPVSAKPPACSIKNAIGAASYSRRSLPI